MNRHNALLLAVTFASMGAGMFLPQAGQHIADLPTAFVLVQLLLCFLATAGPGTDFQDGLRGLFPFLVLKMLLIPLVCWSVFLLAAPQFAFAALLVSGAATGVMAPFLAFLAGGPPLFVTGAVIASSLLMPLTLPALATAGLAVDGRTAAGLAEAFCRTGLFLGACMLGPFLTARAAWTWRPALAEGLLRRRYPVTLVCVAGCMFVIFSKYGPTLRQAPALMAEALTAALALAALLLLLGFVLSPGSAPPSRRLGNAHRRHLPEQRPHCHCGRPFFRRPRSSPGHALFSTAHEHGAALPAVQGISRKTGRKRPDPRKAHNSPKVAQRFLSENAARFIPCPQTKTGGRAQSSVRAHPHKQPYPKSTNGRVRATPPRPRLLKARIVSPALRVPPGKGAERTHPGRLRQEAFFPRRSGW